MSDPRLPFAGPAVPIVGRRQLHLQVAFAQAVCRCDCGGSVALTGVMTPVRCAACGTVYALTGIRIGKQPDGTMGCQIDFSLVEGTRAPEH